MDQQYPRKQGFSSCGMGPFGFACRMGHAIMPHYPSTWDGGYPRIRQSRC